MSINTATAHSEKEIFHKLIQDDCSHVTATILGLLLWIWGGEGVIPKWHQVKNSSIPVSFCASLPFQAIFIRKLTTAHKIIADTAALSHQNKSVHCV